MSLRPLSPLAGHRALLRACGLLAGVAMMAGGPASAKDSGKAEGKPAPAERPATLSSGPAARRAIAAMRSGNWKAARAAWEEVARLEPENAAVLSNLGKVQYQLRDYEAAMKSLEKSVALKPDLTDSWLTLGMVYLELKAPMRAVSATTRGVAETPGDPRARNSLAIVLKRVGWTGAAESELQKALDLDPDYAEAHFNLAVMYLERKPPAIELARRHYERSLELGSAPDTLVEKQLRGEIEITEAEPEENSGETGVSQPTGAASSGESSAQPSPSGPPSSTKRRSSPRKP